MRRLVSLLLALSTTACATVQHGPMQRIHVESEPAGANISLQGCGAGSSRKGTAPGVVWVNRRAKHCTLVLSAAGYRDEIVLLRRSVSETLDDNFALSNEICEAEANCDSLTDFFVVTAFTVLVAGTGVGLDAATGAMFEQRPSRVSVALRPAEIEPEER